MTSLMMSQRRSLLTLYNQTVTLMCRNNSSGSSRTKHVGSTAGLVERKRTSALSKASKKQIRVIKQLHSENKALFGVLLETKQDKVKRTRKELKLMKQLSSATTTDATEKRKSTKQAFLLSNEESSAANVLDEEVDKTLNLLLKDERKRGASRNSGSILPKVSSVRLEHAGMSINKNRVKRDVLQDSTLMGKSSPGTSSVVRAHKGAEIEWAKRNAPTKIKLIELSPSSSSTCTDHVDNTRQPWHEQGHSSTPARTSLPIEETDERKRVGVETTAPSSSSKSSSRSSKNDPHSRRISSPYPKNDCLSPAAEEQGADYLPTVEQLINSFYETGNGQLRPEFETRKMTVSATKSSSSSRSKAQRGKEKERILGGIDFNEHPEKTDDNDHNETQTRAKDLEFSLPYYNPDRNYCTENNDDGSGDQELNAESNTKASITSFPYPFSFSTKSGKDPATSKTLPPASITSSFDATGGLESSSSSPEILDNEMIIKTTSEESPTVVPSVKLPSVSRILNATMPKEQAEALRRWEQKMIATMGVQGFLQYKQGILTNGKSLHSNIERYLRGTPPDEILIAEPNQGHWNSLNAILASIDHVHVLESHVIHPKLQYCGIIDCVAEFRNRLVLIDWKTSQKPKPFVSMTYDTPLQIAAYIGAINYDARYSMKINDGLIVVAYEDGSSCQTFQLDSANVEKYWNLWLKRLQLYRQMNPNSTL